MRSSAIASLGMFSLATAAGEANTIYSTAAGTYTTSCPVPSEISISGTIYSVTVPTGHGGTPVQGNSAAETGAVSNGNGAGSGSNGAGSTSNSNGSGSGSGSDNGAAESSTGPVTAGASKMTGWSYLEMVLAGLAAFAL